MTSEYYYLDNSAIEDEKLEVAKGLYQSGNYSGALKLYLDMVNTSYSYKLYYEIGRCYYKLNNLDESEENFLRSINLESYKNPSYVFLGNIYHKKDDINKAIEYWATSYSYKPDDETVCLNLATSYFAKDMKFQSMFYYEKYLKYAKNKTSESYLEIKKTIAEFEKTSNEFYQKAMRAISMKDKATAIQALDYAVKIYPTKFDTNYLLGKLYLEQQDYMPAMIYLKQAFCLDNKSLDVLEKLPVALIHLGDFTGAYCYLKRLLPLIIHNQKEYLDVAKTIKQLEDSFDNFSYQGHFEWGNRYYSENNYHLALCEYENCVIISGKNIDKVTETIEKLKSFVNSENRIIKTCFEKGGALYSIGNYRQSNKYFSRIMSLTGPESSDYKIAKSRIVNV